MSEVKTVNIELFNKYWIGRAIKNMLYHWINLSFSKLLHVGSEPSYHFFFIFFTNLPQFIPIHLFCPNVLSSYAKLPWFRSGTFGNLTLGKLFNFLQMKLQIKGTYWWSCSSKAKVPLCLKWTPFLQRFTGRGIVMYTTGRDSITEF